jgi:hypothetical protein
MRRVVGGDDDVYLGGILGHPYAGITQGVLERLLAYRENGGVGVVLQEPLGHGDHGVDGLLSRRGEPEPGELLGVHLRVLGGVVGEEDYALAQLAQSLDQALGARQEDVAQVDGAVQIEDVAFVEPLGDPY